MSDATLQQRLDALVKGRIQKQESQISHSLRQIAAGNPLGSETNRTRRVARLAVKTGFDTRQAEALATSIQQTASAIDRSERGGRSKAEAMATPMRPVAKGVRAPLRDEAGPEAVWGTADFIGVEFFTRGRRAANAVGRVAFLGGRAQGTGFIVAPGLILTNNHVIRNASIATSMWMQFDFEMDESGLERSVVAYRFDPARCFASSPINGLDFTLIALGDRVTGTKPLDDFGYLQLSDAGDKHMLGELANIIQHPEGRPKQIVLRENNLVARDETLQVLHYVADTQRGSSGSPVFNNDWEPIALHHWAGPHLETRSVNGKALRLEINEGIRISAIVKALRRGESIRDARTRQAVEEALRLWDGSQRSVPASPRRSEERASASVTAGHRNNGDGSITWTFPIEISVRAPMVSPSMTPPVPPLAPAVPATAERGRALEEEDYSDRGGYEPGFIPGFTVPLPDFSHLGYRLARNQQSTGTDDEFEFRYHHFSLVMNAERRLAAFTACNIDGSRIKHINRETKVVTNNPTLRQLDAESLGPEASDDFRPDSRVLPEEQMTREFYEEQQVPGFEKPEFPAKNASKATKTAYYRAMLERTARMLQKGHIVLRGDPAWGRADEALAAESDTFHYTNAAPQLGFFNQGSRDDHPGEKGKLRWRTVETYVLRNAVTERDRICVFAGPVFDDDDPDYRFGSKLPLRFWKLAVWASEGRLRSVAVLADQGEVLNRLTQGVPEAIEALHGAEAFDDPDELARVSQFLTTVAELERLTGLDFGDDVRNADIRVGESENAALDEIDVMRRRHPSRKATRRGGRRR
jgi:endonuclease G, mitochondrial